MTVRITVDLTEREADALLRVDALGRAGWNPKPSIALANADARIVMAIEAVRNSR